MSLAATPEPIPPTATATSEPEPHIYLVEAGDNLTIIANKFNTTVETIQRTNEIIDGNAIHAGMALEIFLDGLPTVPVAGDSADRNILPNQILCPSASEVAELDTEGGTLIGRSAVCNIPILSYTFGTGNTSLVWVGGMHGGSEWNTILLAYAFIDHLRLNEESIPASLSIIVIPNANPDGLFAVTRHIGRFAETDVDVDTDNGRFNGNMVDLNRNWDCEWASTGVWQNNTVSGGTAPFSEPENQILRDFIVAADPAATVLLHSAATGVHMAGCGQIDPESRVLATVYSQASGYPIYDSFQHYAITGDASNWLAQQGFPAITVELSTHEDIDWRMNLAGLNALINHVAAQTTDD
jgi:predicted deacylase